MSPLHRILYADCENGTTMTRDRHRVLSLSGQRGTLRALLGYVDSNKVIIFVFKKQKYIPPYVRIIPFNR